jgi:bifunctional non-homologous end joining protein LigD
MSIVEIHTWSCLGDATETPDRIVIDLDPDPGVPWRRVVEAAGLVRGRLEALGLGAFVKTTGGKGLHIVSPLVPEASWQEVFAFSRAFAEGLVAEAPRAFTTAMPKARRRGKILIDYLRNNRGNTSVCALSPRATKGAPVSWPVSWRELSRIDPTAPTVATVPRMLRARKTDPWAGYDEARRALRAARSIAEATSRSRSGTSPGRASPRR